MENYNWAVMPKPGPREIMNGDIRKVTLPVEVLMEWRTDLPDERDCEGNVTSYTSGFIMNILPTKIRYSDQETLFLAQSVREKP